MGWKRTIQTYQVKAEPLASGLTNDTFFDTIANTVPNGIFLAHMIDGVVWGRVGDFSQVKDTLQELRVFDENQQLHVWRNGAGWGTWHVQDAVAHADEISAFDEYHILWGTSTEDTDDPNFTRLIEGAQGFRQQLPINVSLPKFDAQNPLTDRITMKIRHYLGEHDNGMNYVAFSRIVKLVRYDYQNGKEMPMGGE